MVAEKKKTVKEVKASSETHAKTEHRELKTENNSNCIDRKCAIHGTVETRGRVFEGIVVSDKMQKTITLEWPRLNFLQKYERYEKRHSKIHAHNPPCLSAKTGDKVRVAECRPLAKTVTFVVIEVLK